MNEEYVQIPKWFLIPVMFVGWGVIEMLLWVVKWIDILWIG